MASQIPAGAEGAVAGVMVYCSICLICSSLMIWLTWTHNERTSYVAIISYFATLSIAASLFQQTHDVVRYRDIVVEQFWNRKHHANNPEIAVSNGSVGLSLALYYIQYYCYSVEAMAVMFWAAFLAQSVYGLSSRPKIKVILRRVNQSGKIFAIVFPLTTILLLRIPAVQSNFVVFILLADLPLMLSLLFGCTLMLLILGRYVQSKRKFLHWSDDAGGSGTTASALDTSTEQGSQPKRRQGLYDRWLMVRFSIAFLALSIFEVTNTLFQIAAVTNANKDAQSTEPDLSADRAKGSWVMFMPGVTPGLFIFIIFGTTRPLRRFMYESIVPNKWQRKSERQPKQNVSRSVIREDVGPPVPRKNSVRLGTEHVAYGPQGEFPGDNGGGRSKQVVIERQSSDEWPMLPIMKNNGGSGEYSRRI